MLTSLVLAGAAAFAIPNPAGAMNAPTQGAGMFVSIVTAGEVDPAGVLPAINGVPDAQVTNWDIAFPTGVLKTGHQYEIETLINDNNYTGSCKGNLELAQEQKGKKVVLAKFDVIGGGSCSSGFIYGRSEVISVPDSPGPATLSGTVRYGSNKQTLSVPIVIQ